jgi:hypothetical protein
MPSDATSTPLWSSSLNTHVRNFLGDWNSRVKLGHGPCYRSFQNLCSRSFVGLNVRAGEKDDFSLYPSVFDLSSSALDGLLTLIKTDYNLNQRSCGRRLYYIED